MEKNEQNTSFFQIPVELELVKSVGGGSRRMVRGYASMEKLDQQGEIILQHGIDFSPLLKSGFLNYDHQYIEGIPGVKMPTIVGYPTRAEIRDKGLWVEGELLKSDDPNPQSEQLKMANELWELGLALQKSGGRRSLAYSVEGGVLQRHGNKIVKSIVRALAITHKPVMEDATVEMFQKSQMCCGRCHPDHPLYTKGHSCGAHAPISKEDKENAEEAVQKSMSTESAAPLMLQNLDKRMTSVLYGEGASVGGCDCCEPAGRFKDGLTGAVGHLQKCRGLSKSQSIDFMRKVIHHAHQRPELAALVQKAGLTGK